MTNFSAHWDYKNHCPKNANSSGVSSTVHSRRSSEGLVKRGSVGKKLVCKLSSCAKYFCKKSSQNRRNSIIGLEKSEFSP
jgi:hypothetical protein